MHTPELIVMLTNNDFTVENAADIFDACKCSDARYWGAKEKGLPLEQMKELYSAFRQSGKTGVLEVVAYTEEAGLQGAKMAAQCGCEILLGTLFYDSINTFCQDHNIKYMPFVGTVSGRPSVLEGSAEDMVSQALAYLEKGAYGIDLLSYRYQADPVRLSRELVSKIDAPVCMAGSINSYQRLDQVQAIGPAFYTIGGAFWNNQFGDDALTQINRVCRYMKQPVPLGV